MSSHIRPGSRENPLCWHLGEAETLAFKGSETARERILADVQESADLKGEHYMIVGSPDKPGKPSVLANVHPGPGKEMSVRWERRD